MKKLIALLILSTFNIYALTNNEMAPDFTLLGEDGKKHSLSEYKGKTVILEWLNHGCPFVRKHYDSKNMQKTQKYAKDKGFIWLSIISSAPNKQGHVDSEGALKERLENESLADHILLDPTGQVGQSYQAKTTPHMYIISKTGKLLYQGAIDSINSTDKSDIKSATNYITKAIGELSANKKIKNAKTRPYGCSVKYK